MKGNSYPMEIIHLAEVEDIENCKDASFCHILSREGLTSMTWQIFTESGTNGHGTNSVVRKRKMVFAF